MDGMIKVSYTVMCKNDVSKQISLSDLLVNEKVENIGARRLHTVMTSLLEDVLFSVPDDPIKSVTVDGKMVEK